MTSLEHKPPWKLEQKIWKTKNGGSNKRKQWNTHAPRRIYCSQPRPQSSQTKINFTGRKVKIYDSKTEWRTTNITLCIREAICTSNYGNLDWLKWRKQANIDKNMENAKNTNPEAIVHLRHLAPHHDLETASFWTLHLWGSEYGEKDRFWE